MTAFERTHSSALEADGSVIDLRDDYWLVVDRTVDLVSRLTALAGRYEAAAERDAPVRADQRRAQAAQMRALAASGRRLAASLSPPPAGRTETARPSSADPGDRARLRDVQASTRDERAERRDQRASDRDVRAGARAADVGGGFADRFLSACDRDDAAGDRVDAQTDRAAAFRDREESAAASASVGQDALIASLDEKATLEQAQGVLMATQGVTAEQALESIGLLSRLQAISEADAAAAVVESATRRSAATALES